MTTRNLRFALLSIVVVAAGIAIAITVRKRFATSHDDTRAATASADRTGPGGSSGPTGPTGAGAGPGPTAGGAGAGGAGQGPGGTAGGTDPAGGAAGGTAGGTADGTGAGSDRPTTTYVMDDGTVFRDHRRGGGGPPVATTPLPPEQRTMSPDLTARVYQAISPKVATCGGQVPAEARGADPFVYVNLTVEVDGDILSTTDVLPVAHDVADASAGPLVACVRDGLATLRVDAKGEPDQSRYVLQYPIKIR